MKRHGSRPQATHVSSPPTTIPLAEPDIDDDDDDDDDDDEVVAVMVVCLVT